jgi:hypothetical protein
MIGRDALFGFFAPSSRSGPARPRAACVLWLVVILINNRALIAAPAEAEKVTGVSHEPIQARVATNFNAGVLFKPRESGSESSPLERLAPLIIQQTLQTNPPQLWADQPDVTGSNLVIHGTAGSTTIGSRKHPQFSYTWSYPTNHASPAGGHLQQGVRITLNSAGSPVIWEVAQDSTGKRVVYVSRWLEEAARLEIGGPLPGRKFAIERHLVETPEVVVANVIEDGPVPMGPILYLQAGSRDVLALICRCMPSQVRNLAGQADYALEPGEAKPCAETIAPADLARALRLPGSF